MATIKEILGDSYKEGMTFAEVETALEGVNLANLSKGGYVSEDKYKNNERRLKEAEGKLREKLTDDEKRQAEYAEREEHYKRLERENNVMKTKQKLSKSISDERLVDELAELYADGKVLEAIDKQNAYYAKKEETIKKTVESSLLKQDGDVIPPPTNKTSMTKEQIMAISDPIERQKAIAQNINLFN